MAIVGGGYIKIETAYVKTPMAVFPVQKHQMKLVKDFKNSAKYLFCHYLQILIIKILKKLLISIIIKKN